MNVVIGVPVFQTIEIDTIKFLLKQRKRIIIIEQGYPRDVVRNKIVEKFLKIGEKYLLFLDSDVVPPDDIIQKLKKCKKDIVGAICPIASCSGSLKPENGFIKPNCYPYFPDKKLYEVEWIGTGCLLVSRRVFEDIKGKYFEGHNEELSFFEKARKKGYKIFALNEYCKHIRKYEMVLK